MSIDFALAKHLCLSVFSVLETLRLRLRSFKSIPQFLHTDSKDFESFQIKIQKPHVHSKSNRFQEEAKIGSIIIHISHFLDYNLLNKMRSHISLMWNSGKVLASGLVTTGLKVSAIHMRYQTNKTFTILAGIMKRSSLEFHQ